MDVTKNNEVTETIGNENNGCSCISHETEVKHNKWNNQRVKHQWITMSQHKSTWVIRRWVTWESKGWLLVSHVRKGWSSVMWPTVKVHVINKEVKMKEKLYIVTCHDKMPMSCKRVDLISNSLTEKVQCPEEHPQWWSSWEGGAWVWDQICMSCASACILHLKSLELSHPTLPWLGL